MNDIESDHAANVEKRALSHLLHNDQYKVQKKIGSGSFSNVYLATRKMSYSSLDNTVDESQMEQYVAIKIVEDVHISSSEILSGMVLDYEFIGRMLEWFAIGSFYYLVFEYIDGEDLQILFSEYGPFKEDFFHLIFFQIVTALKYCHDEGVVHRDIKMENIVVYGPDKQNVKLVDFGFSFFLTCPSFPHDAVKIKKRTESNQFEMISVYKKDQLTADNITIGTPEYCAPEIILGAIANEDNLISTDIYSLGVLMHYALIGYPPYGSDFYRFLLNEGEKYKHQTNSQHTRKLYKDPLFSHELIQRSNASRSQQKSQFMNNSQHKISLEAYDLIKRMIHPNPLKRITMDELINHSWVRMFES